MALYNTICYLTLTFRFRVLTPLTLIFRVVVPFLSPLIFSVVAFAFDVILATFVFVYLLFIDETLPSNFTTAVPPFFTLTVVLDSFGAVVTVTLQVSFLPVVRVAVIVTVPLLSAVIFPFLTVATFLFEVAQAFAFPLLTLNICDVPDFKHNDK